MLKVKHRHYHQYINEDSNHNCNKFYSHFSHSEPEAKIIMYFYEISYIYFLFTFLVHYLMTF